MAGVVFTVLGKRTTTPAWRPANAGGKIDVKVYAGATHGFDGDPAPTRRFRIATVENGIDGEVFAEPDGRFA